MASSPTSPEKQFGISMRYRSEQPSLEDLQEERYTWRLERNKRYRMQLRLLNSSNQADQTTVKSVQYFNQINERCADQIGLAKELKLKVVQYLSILEAAGNESQSNVINENHATSLNINTNFLDPCSETGNKNINRQIQTLRAWQANLNSARLLSKEADLALQKGRKLFNELLNNCAHCLFQTDGRD
ncbi:hypothetical protein PHET_06801 [Paragonimus heterotremus]|uniref:Uncharacterized protein n=1 Tax=Paragonimus heterotremus TaxID=100268 RepID=A0A8J4SN88_9TREM|nr:hypothetical protein PHET_06801 [Paragonimus heterotremus]